MGPRWIYVSYYSLVHIAQLVARGPSSSGDSIDNTAAHTTRQYHEPRDARVQSMEDRTPHHQPSGSRSARHRHVPNDAEAPPPFPRSSRVTIPPLFSSSGVVRLIQRVNWCHEVVCPSTRGSLHPRLVRRAAQLSVCTGRIVCDVLGAAETCVMKIGAGGGERRVRALTGYAERPVAALRVCAWLLSLVLCADVWTGR